MRGDGSRDHSYLSETEYFRDLFGKPQVSEMDRVEGAPEKSDGG